SGEMNGPIYGRVQPPRRPEWVRLLTMFAMSLPKKYHQRVPTTTIHTTVRSLCLQAVAYATADTGRSINMITTQMIPRNCKLGSRYPDRLIRQAVKCSVGAT